jgi:hypothetical protein
MNELSILGGDSTSPSKQALVRSAYNDHGGVSKSGHIDPGALP